MSVNFKQLTHGRIRCLILDCSCTQNIRSMRGNYREEDSMTTNQLPRSECLGKQSSLSLMNLS